MLIDGPPCSVLGTVKRVLREIDDLPRFMSVRASTISSYDTDVILRTSSRFVHHLYHPHRHCSEHRSTAILPLHHRIVWKRVLIGRWRNVGDDVTTFCAPTLTSCSCSVTDLFKPGTTDIPVAIYTLSPLVGKYIRKLEP